MIDRAHLVSAVRERATALKMVGVLTAVLAAKLADDDASCAAGGGGLRQVQRQLVEEIAFLPAAARPPHFPLRWAAAADDADADPAAFLHRPADLFPPECRDLVGCAHLVADAAVFAGADSAQLLTFLRLGLEWKEPTVAQVGAALLTARRRLLCRLFELGLWVTGSMGHLGHVRVTGSLGHHFDPV